jgi:hypothetical protein
MKITADQHVGTYEARRLAELEEQIPLLDKAMADARDRIERFVAGNPQCRTIFAHGGPAVRVGAMQLRHPDLRALETELDNFVARWHATLGEYAALKQERRRG